MLTISLEITALRGAQISQSGDGSSWVSIPVSECFRADSGKVFVTLDVHRHLPNKYDNTALVRQRVARVAYDAMTDAERQAMPIVGRGK